MITSASPNSESTEAAQKRAVSSASA